MGLLERISARTVDRAPERRFAIDPWIADYLIPSSFQFGGVTYPFGNGVNTTWLPARAAEVANDLPGYLSALRGCPPAFAAQMVRAMVLSQVRFTFRNPPWHPRRPRQMFGTGALQALERPWPNATTGELVGRMEWHEGLTGNAYVLRRPERLRVLRPDWVGIVYGSQLEPEDPGHAIDGDLLGYVYCNGGFVSGNTIHTLLPQDVAHWSPLPDPQNAGVGMSWLTPAIRDIQADRLATQHKIQYFEHGATPNLVVKGIPATNREQFNEAVDMLEAKHAGVANAYRTLYLTAGADATVVGSNLKDLDLKNVQGAGETRISMLSRVHPTILAVAEGLAGSSLNAGNFGMARRIWADSWIYPTLQDLAAAVAPLVRVPEDAELWFDSTDMPILREDAKDAAEINQIKMSTAVAGVNGGWDAESVKAYVDSGDVRVLKHTGLLSVQLQPPGTQPTPPEDGGAGPKALPPTRASDGNGRLGEDNILDSYRHLPGLHDQKTHGNWSPKVKAVKAAKELAELKESIEKAQAKAAKFAEAAAASVDTYAKPTAAPTRMTKGQYTKLLKDEHIRLHILDGKSQQEAKAAARPAATIDELKQRNNTLRRKLRDAGVDYRTDEQRRTDDAEKNALLDEVQRLATTGGHDGTAKRAAAAKMTVPELRKFVKDVTDYQQRQAEKAKAARESAAAQREWEARQGKLRATDRQVDYILNLIERRRRSGEGGGFMVGPTDRAGIARMSRADASAYIDSLRGTY